jgi:hypothetical protein
MSARHADPALVPDPPARVITVRTVAARIVDIYAASRVIWRRTAE